MADDRPPICPACGVTMGIVVDEETGETRNVCQECGFEDDERAHYAPKTMQGYGPGSNGPSA